MIIKPCPYCGAEGESPEWGAVLEFSTKSEQTCYLDCPECPFGCTINVDPESLKDGDVQKIEDQLCQVWNSFDHFIKQEPSND